MSTKEKTPPVVPPLDLSKIEGWNDTYFKVDRKKSRKKKSKETTTQQDTNKQQPTKKPEPTNGLGDVGEGLGLSDEVSQASPRCSMKHRGRTNINSIASKSACRSIRR